MSYDIELVDPISGKVLETDIPHHMRGGTYAVGSTTYLELNITYNYAEHFRRVIDQKKGIRFLYGKSGAESIPILREAIGQLGNDISKDYWEPTEGNAKQALLQLLSLAYMRPDGIWKGD